MASLLAGVALLVAGMLWTRASAVDAIDRLRLSAQGQIVSVAGHMLCLASHIRTGFVVGQVGQGLVLGLSAVVTVRSVQRYRRLAQTAHSQRSGR